MTQPELQPPEHDAYPTEKSRRSLLWRMKLRLQFTGWLQYLMTVNALCHAQRIAFGG